MQKRKQKKSKTTIRKINNKTSKTFHDENRGRFFFSYFRVMIVHIINRFLILCGIFNLMLLDEESS